MKKSTIILFILTAIFACTSQNAEYTINGYIENADGILAELWELRQSKDWIRHDSCTIKSGRFHFAGTTDNPVAMTITFKGAADLELFVENADIRVEGTPDNWGQVKVTGSKSDKEYRQFMDAFNKTFDENNLEGSQWDSIFKLEKEYIMKYVNDNPSSFISAHLLCSFKTFLYQLEDLEREYASFSADVKTSSQGVELSSWIGDLKRQQIGAQIMDFSLPDTLGNMISTKEFRGKYLLMDFWSSSCGPCRKEHPKFIELYKKYRDQGFEIYSVSLDDKRANWIAAMKKDQLSWTQVSDLKGWNSAAKDLYKFKAIPENFLFDPDGILIAHGLNGVKLEKELKEILW